MLIVVSCSLILIVLAALLPAAQCVVRGSQMEHSGSAPHSSSTGSWISLRKRYLTWLHRKRSEYKLQMQRWFSSLELWIDFLCLQIPFSILTLHYFVCIEVCWTTDGVYLLGGFFDLNILNCLFSNAYMYPLVSCIMKLILCSSFLSNPKGNHLVSYSHYLLIF